MANPNKVWGRTTIIFDGVEYDMEGKSTLKMGGTKRNAVQADNRTGLFSEELTDAELDCSALVTGGGMVPDFSDATVLFVTDAGFTYMIAHAYRADPAELSDGKDKIMVRGAKAELVQ
jgi:hypothetical protein